MRIVTIEEHVSFSELAEDIKKHAAHKVAPLGAVAALAPKLDDIDNDRLQSMDANGIEMQVLSVVGPGADLVNGTEGITIARRYNDMLAAKIGKHGNRFAAFAHLPMRSPDAAAEELKRAVIQHNFKGALVNGMTNDEFLDEPKFAPVFEAAVQMNVPIYLHPGLPPQKVEEIYFSDLPRQSGKVLSVAGWGWHAETALHVIRLIISGVFDRYPGLNLIIGHMGEMLPMMMARCDMIFPPDKTGKNQRTISQTLKDQVYITTSGLFTHPPLMAAIATFGIDRVIFSVDYPFSTNEQGKEFADSLPLSDGDKEKILYKNVDALLKLQ